jgi:two-component sensor histidine kinase
MTRSARLAACATLPANILYTVIFNTVIAALLAAVGFGGGFGVNLVYSQCIGLPAFLLSHGARRLLWPNQRTPIAMLLPLLVATLLLAWFGGTWLAALLLGHPWRAEGYLTSLMITAAAGFVAVLFFWEREKVAELETEAAQQKSLTETIERQAAQARLALLQAQIEPHFLFNTLANLQALIGADPARAQVMLSHLNDFLRASLSAARKDRNTLAEEFALLRDYLELLSIRMGARLAFRLDLPQELAQIQVPPMLLQPLVENAVKHGLEPKVEGGEVTVIARREGGRVVLHIADSGMGFAAAATSGTNVGLAHLRERLAAIYGAGASLVIAENAQGGVSVTLDLPLPA